MIGPRGRGLIGLWQALLLASFACGRGGPDGVRVAAGTPVVLISIDTLRSDRLPAYGYTGVEAPHIDSLRQDSILFARAYSHVPFTLPSHVSLLTGLLPGDHGVRDNVGYPFAADQMPYLPRVFEELGYATGATVSAYVLNGNTGLAADWDLYDDEVPVLSGRDLGGLHRPGEQTLERALEWLETVAEQPFFLFFHIYEPHTPYDAPEPVASRYTSPYDAEVAVADAVIGKLLAALRQKGLYERSIILLLSDHGEGLMDHGDPEHNLFVYREVLQVPLILKLPQSQQGGSTVEAPVQLTDVFPTLLDLLGLDPPAELHGTSLLRAHSAAEPVKLYSENFYPRLHFGWSELTSLIDWPYHLIYGPDPELYNLADDPGETHNLLHEQRHIYGALRQELARYDRELERPQDADEETRERLAALGYIGGGNLGKTAGPRPDPKSKLGTFSQLREAFKSFGENDFERAVKQFQGLLANEPQMIAAWRYLARSLRKLGRKEEALAAYEQALTLSEGAPEIARGAAELLLEMGRLEEAKSHAQLALPTHEIAYEILATVALRQKSLEEAERYSQQAVAKRGGHLSPLITRALVLVELKRFDEAIALSREVVEEFGDRQDGEVLKGLYLARGRAYAEMGEAEAAIEAFRQEIALSPESYAPYTHLALVYALLGQGREAGQTLRLMVETNPSPAAYAESVRTLRLMGDARSASLVLREARRRWPDSAELRELASSPA